MKKMTRNSAKHLVEWKICTIFVPENIKYEIIWAKKYRQEKNCYLEWKLQKKESVSALLKWKCVHANCSRKEQAMNPNMFIRYESIGYWRNQQIVTLQSKQGPIDRLLVFCNEKWHTVGNWLHWWRFDTLSWYAKQATENKRPEAAYLHLGLRLTSFQMHLLVWQPL